MKNRFSVKGNEYFVFSIAGSFADGWENASVDQSQLGICSNGETIVAGCVQSMALDIT